MKTKYILKTNNDLQFDFYHGDSIRKIEGYWDTPGSAPYYTEMQIEELENILLPFVIDIDYTPYIIIKMTKIKEEKNVRKY